MSRRRKKSSPDETVRRFAAESGVPLVAGDVYLAKTGIVSKGARHRLTLKRSKSKLALECETFPYTLTHWVVGACAVGAAITLFIGAVVDADFVSPKTVAFGLLAVIGCAAFSYGTKWLANRSVGRNNPLLLIDANSGNVSIRNGRSQLHKGEIVCLMLMNSRGRTGRAETTVFQFKVLSSALDGKHHEEFVIIQNGTLPLDHYHEQLIPLARVLKTPLVECDYDFRQFHLRRIVGPSRSSTGLVRSRFARSFRKLHDRS